MKIGSNAEPGFGYNNGENSNNTGCQNGTEDDVPCSIILDHQYIEGQSHDHGTSSNNINTDPNIVKTPPDISQTTNSIVFNGTASMGNFNIVHKKGSTMRSQRLTPKIKVLKESPSSAKKTPQ